MSNLRNLLVWLVLATGAAAADVEITDPWARAPPGAAVNGAVYLSLTNHGADTTIIATASPTAKAASLHGHEMDGDMMRMRALEYIALGEGEAVTFAPGGLHIMLMGLKAPLKEGMVFPLALTFEKAGTLSIRVRTRKITSMGPGDHGGHEDHMKQMKQMDHKMPKGSM